MMQVNTTIPDDMAFHETSVPSVKKWNNLHDSDHLVQFYEADDFLLEALSGYVEDSYNSGDVCIVVATQTHLSDLGKILQKKGQDFSSTLISLDARETMSRFMVEEQPNPELFKSLIGTIIDQTGQGKNRVRIYGEMVALLWSDSKFDAALRLEQLWNELAKTHRFTLCCAYPIREFNSNIDVSLSEVCGHHSVVIPGESYSLAATDQERLAVITGLQQKAKALEREIAERAQTERRLRTSEKRYKRLLKREQQARLEAQRANQMKDEFLANVSHELRTPLTSLFGWARLLRSANLDPTGMSRALECIERSVQTQRQLVEDLLDVSRIVAGKVRLDMTSVVLESVMDTALEIFRPAAESKHICVDVLFEPGIPQIQADPIRLQQTFNNLLSNAIKFTPEKGKVLVRLTREEDKVKISVEDTGEGIAPEFLPYVFDRFRQADSTTTRKHGGLGLGLTIARHLMVLHGGEIHAESAGKEQGSRFTISLPIDHTIDGTVQQPSAASFISASSS